MLINIAYYLCLPLNLNPEIAENSIPDLKKGICYRKLIQHLSSNFKDHRIMAGDINRISTMQISDYFSILDNFKLSQNAYIAITTAVVSDVA